MTQSSQKEQYARMVCLFLAEGLRTRKISLKKAADIADKVLVHLNLLDSEMIFLKFVKELAHDFEELNILEKQIVYDQARSNRKKFEQEVKEFAIEKLNTDPSLAMAILADASQDGASAESITAKYPEFKSYHHESK
ncbi:MAG: hypothetical protein KW793_00105 [Candidatus Doudnabacteria bacterium]|nr:hypothetical protein [Candidatus Doudnabacteria bacterium]